MTAHQWGQEDASCGSSRIRPTGHGEDIRPHVNLKKRAENSQTVCESYDLRTRLSPAFTLIGGDMPRVLVTGAAGFIGSHLCEALLTRGCDVRGLDAFTTFYDPRRKRHNLTQLSRHPRFELVQGDLLEVPL